MTYRQTIGFGCPNVLDPHHFVVEIPAGRTACIAITEHYGTRAGIHGNPEIAERCYLPRRAWAVISEDVKREFNQRLKEKCLSTSRWRIGENKVERLLGKELLVLAWSIEQADISVIPNAIRNWMGLKPEERWWLYTMTAAATGTPDDAGIGWRKALQHALIENPLKDTPFLSDRSTGSLKLRQRSKGDASQRKLQIIDFSNNAPNVSVSTSQNAMTAGGARWT
jgi:hypothetical protein